MKRFSLLRFNFLILIINTDRLCHNHVFMPDLTKLKIYQCLRMILQKTTTKIAILVDVDYPEYLQHYISTCLSQLKK